MTENDKVNNVNNAPVASESTAVATVSCEKKKLDEKPKKKMSKRSIWTIKITVITFFLSGFFAFLSEISSNYLNTIISTCILLFLILTSIVFDGIGVAATACDISPLLAMAARKVPGANVAVMLAKNAEKVSNICADVIGDICGIVSGTCSVAIVLSLKLPEGYYWVNILMSAVVSAMMVGGKAFNKDISIKNAKEVIMLAAKVLSIFYHPRDKKTKKAKK